MMQDIYGPKEFKQYSVIKLEECYDAWNPRSDAPRILIEVPVLMKLLADRDRENMRKGFEAAREQTIDRMGYLDSSAWLHENVYDDFDAFWEGRK